MGRVSGIPKPPASHLPAVVQAKKWRERAQAIAEQAERQRRLLWLAVDAAGGRIEIDPEDYRMATQGPASDYYVQARTEDVYDQKQGKTVRKAVLVMVDEDGNVEERSEQKRIISTEA